MPISLDVQQFILNLISAMVNITSSTFVNSPNHPILQFKCTLWNPEKSDNDGETVSP